MKKLIISVLAGVVLLAFLAGCAATVYAPAPPPPPKAEVKPDAPNPRAAWISGHWSWDGHKYVWKSGYWVKTPRGRWVGGHWKKTPHGHVWVGGYWGR